MKNLLYSQQYKQIGSGIQFFHLKLKNHREIVSKQNLILPYQHF